MTMREWAKQEVELACKKENPERKEDEFDYGCACYESALKAFNSLCEDGHSGYSIGVTKTILNRLIDNLPLTPIEDTEDAWDKNIVDKNDEEEYVCYQCNRMSSLFKYIYKDGTIKYNDVSRTICVDINTGSSFTSSLANRIVNEIYPISLPYSGERIKIYMEDFLYDKKNGDYDTVGVYYMIKNDEKIEINKFYKESDFAPYSIEPFIEISKEEYEERKKNKIVKY